MYSSLSHVLNLIIVFFIFYYYAFMLSISQMFHCCFILNFCCCFCYIFHFTNNFSCSLCVFFYYLILNFIVSEISIWKNGLLLLVIKKKFQLFGTINESDLYTENHQLKKTTTSYSRNIMTDNTTYFT